MFELFQRRLTRLEALNELNALITYRGAIATLPLTPWRYDQIIGALKRPETTMPTVFVHFYRPGQVVAILRDWWAPWN